MSHRNLESIGAQYVLDFVECLPRQLFRDFESGSYGGFEAHLKLAGIDLRRNLTSHLGAEHK